jgi:hypothetical protein
MVIEPDPVGARARTAAYAGIEPRAVHADPPAAAFTHHPCLFASPHINEVAARNTNISALLHVVALRPARDDPPVVVADAPCSPCAADEARVVAGPVDVPAQIV